jgi:hypothetical protein
MMMFCTSGCTCIWVSTCCRVPKMTTDRTTPITVPRPPKIETPPNRTIATTLSSRPVPAS